MNHDTFTEKISLWLDDELSPSEAADLQTHLTKCPSCQQVYQAMQHVHHFLDNASRLMAAPSPGFTTRFEARLAQNTAKRWHAWLGLGVLLISTLLLVTVGAIVGGVTLISISTVLLDTRALYEWLGMLGGIVNQIRAYINLSGLFLKVAFITMSQPLFWLYVAVTLGLTWLWVRVIQMVYRRAPVNVELLV
jgi:hypothetical protein